MFKKNNNDYKKKTNNSSGNHNKGSYQGHHARKNFGQNFLRDQQVIANIINLIAPGDQETVVEIGPGLGALTEPVCEIIKHLNVIEIDRDLAYRLRHHPFIRDQLTIYEQDALTMDFSKLKEEDKNLKIYGNLPYNISTPLLFHLFEYSDVIADMTFMLQKEVVDRLVAGPDSGDYGKLTIMAQYFAKIVPCLEVPPEAFTPSPKVYSAVVKVIPHKSKPYVARDYDLLEQIVSSAFNQRRKTIHNSLENFFTDQIFNELDIDPKMRAENLSIEQYINLANYLAEHRE